MTAKPEPIALSIREVLDRIPIGRTSLYGAIGRGELIARKIERRTIILESDLRAWLQGLPPLKTVPNGDPENAS